jgi:hypothetical protein
MPQAGLAWRLGVQPDDSASTLAGVALVNEIQAAVPEDLSLHRAERVGDRTSLPDEGVTSRDVVLVTPRAPHKVAERDELRGAVLQRNLDGIMPIEIDRRVPVLRFALLDGGESGHPDQGSSNRTTCDEGPNASLGRSALQSAVGNVVDGTVNRNIVGNRRSVNGSLNLVVHFELLLLCLFLMGLSVISVFQFFHIYIDEKMIDM